MTREFHADPNLHKNSNVELVGDFSTGGSPSVSFEWSWKWKPPRPIEDRGGGWRNTCSVCSIRFGGLKILVVDMLVVRRVRPESPQARDARQLLVLGCK